MTDVRYSMHLEGVSSQEVWWWLTDRKAMDIGSYSGPRPESKRL